MSTVDFGTLMQSIEGVGSRLDKEKLLEQLDARGQRILKWSLDPITTFGITVEERDYEFNDSCDYERHDSFWELIESLCYVLSVREVTGNAAAREVERYLRFAPCSNDRKWAKRVLNKNLRCGVQITTANKVFPGLIEPFSVALAEPYKPEKHELSGKWCIEPKLDGLRMTIVDGVPYTRNGRIINTVDHILHELEDYTKDYVFDGEVMGAGDFDEASGNIRRKDRVANIDICYNVFDMVAIEQWIKRETDPLFMRKRDMSIVFSSIKETAPASVRMVAWMELPENPTTEQLFKMRDDMMSSGYEGSMIKNMNSPYTFARSSDILKLKDFKDADCTVVDTYVGKGRHKGRLGGIVVELDGVQTKLGSGFSDKQREDLWTSRSSILGSIVEVQYQNKTADGSLRFPVFIKFRHDKE